MSSAALVIGGISYEGWLRMNCQRSIDQGSGQFALDLTERNPGNVTKWKIEPGAECVLMLDGYAAVSGFVDRSERELGKDRYRIAVSGRDATADLVDCSACRADGSVGEISGLRLDALAKALTKNYKVGVKVDANTPLGEPFATWSIEPGETVFESLERAARQRALLLVSDGLGNLVITRGGSVRHPVALVEGETILTARVIRDDSQRFNQYVVKGQSDIDGGTAASARATDDGVRAPRRLLIVAEDMATGTTLKDRVLWERTIRRARGRSVEITVEGFSAGGALWSPNLRVAVKVPTLAVDAEMIIAGVTNTVGERECGSVLTLIPKDALSLLPAAAKTGSALQ